MIKKVNAKWLEKWPACEDELSECIKWFKKQKTDDPIKLIRKLIKAEKWEWINHCFKNTLTKKQAVKSTIYAAVQIINLFEKEFPEDKRPREAIKSALAYLKKPTKKNKDAAKAAAGAAMRKKIALHTVKILKKG